MPPSYMRISKNYNQIIKSFSHCWLHSNTMENSYIKNDTTIKTNDEYVSAETDLRTGTILINIEPTFLAHLKTSIITISNINNTLAAIGGLRKYDITMYLRFLYLSDGNIIILNKFSACDTERYIT